MSQNIVTISVIDRTCLEDVIYCVIGLECLVILKKKKYPASLIIDTCTCSSKILKRK